MKRIILIATILLAGTTATMLAQGVTVRRTVAATGTYGVNTVDTATYRKSGNVRRRTVSTSGRSSIRNAGDAGSPNRRRVQLSNQQVNRPTLKRSTPGYSDYDVEELPFHCNSIGLNLGVINLFYNLGSWRSNGFHFAVQYGYYFSPDIGLNFQFFVHNFQSALRSVSTSMQHDGLLAGPIMSVPLSRSRTAELLFKPALGLGWASSTDADRIKGDSFGFGLAAGMGIAVCFNLGTNFTLPVNFDLYYSKVEGKNFSGAATSVGACYSF
jgi:opacity protein-like surface antigen